MGFYFRDPQTFPAIFPEALRQAHSNPDQWITVYRTKSRSDCEAKLGLFKWYRWCIKQKASAYPDLASILETSKIRGKVDFHNETYQLLARSQPDLIPSLQSLNPHLSDLFQSDCQ